MQRSDPQKAMREGVLDNGEAGRLPSCDTTTYRFSVEHRIFGWVAMAMQQPDTERVNC